MPLDSAHRAKHQRYGVLNQAFQGNEVDEVETVSVVFVNEHTGTYTNHRREDGNVITVSYIKSLN